MFGSFGLNSGRLQQSLKKYGRTGLFTYLGLSSMVTTGFYVAIERNVDVKQIVGLKDDPDAEPSLLQRALLGPGSHLALAILCSKACIPLKLPVAVALTPYVYRMQARLLPGTLSKIQQRAAAEQTAQRQAAGAATPSTPAQSQQQQPQRHHMPPQQQQQQQQQHGSGQP